MLPKTALFLARRTHERFPTKALSLEPRAGLFLCIDLKKRLCGRHLGVAHAKKLNVRSALHNVFADVFCISRSCLFFTDDMIREALPIVGLIVPGMGFVSTVAIHDRSRHGPWKGRAVTRQRGIENHSEIRAGRCTNIK